MAQAVLTPPVDPAPMRLVGSPRRRRKERIMRLLLKSAAILTFLITVGIVLSILREAITFFIDVPKDSLWSIGWFPRRGLFDIPTLLIGTFLVTIIAMAVAVPLGLGAAIYLSEYANPRVRKVVKPILEILAGIPSVVLGYFALTYLNPELVQRFFSDASVFNLAAAGVAVGVLTLPLMASVSEDAMRVGARLASGGLLRPRRPAPHDIAAGGVPRCHLGHHRRLHPCRLTSRRRDDGGRHRGRCHRWRPAQLGSAEAWSDHDGRHGGAGCRLGPGEG